jgi:hypothetical protein
LDPGIDTDWTPELAREQKPLGAVGGSGGGASGSGGGGGGVDGGMEGGGDGCGRRTNAMEFVKGPSKGMTMLASVP